MPTRGDTQINSFVKGLVTEASPLSFPPNTALDILNFRLNKDGTNFRRLGLDFEDGYLLTATGYSSDVLATARKAFYHWQLPNGEPLADIGVVQIGAKFWFLNLYAESPSAALLNGGNAVTAAVDPSSKFSFAVINNYLLVVSNNLPDPYLVSYDYALDSVTFETSPILVRDMWGVDDGIDIGARPTTLTSTHYYNLLNQGWSNDIVSTCTPAGISAIDCTQITLGVYPSNSDVWTIGRIGDLTSADVHKYDPNIAARNIFNIGQVPQGHYILRLKDRGAERQLQTGLSVPLDREIGTISCVAAYAGRAFYSGILSQIQGGDKRSPILSGAVLFSQTFEQKIQLVKCYQEADPTSPDISDILDTDGGIIFIPECSVVNHLRAVKESLLVFAINGIWEIKGTEGGFTANSFQVHKISNVGVYSPDSIVEINGQILFWGINGIYALAQNQFGVWETNSITKPTIQKMYDSIPDFARSQAKGYYDLNRNTVRWLYYSDDAKVAGQAIDVTPPVALPALLSVGASLNTVLASEAQRVIRVSDTSYMLLYKDKTSKNLKAVMVTVADDLSLTMGTPVTIRATNTGSSTGTTFNFAGYLIDTNKVIVTYGESAVVNAYANILTISSTSIAVGSIQTLFATSGYSGVEIVSLTTTTALLTYNIGVTPARARVLTISGDTITAGASNNIGTSSISYAIAKVDATRVVVLLADPTNNIAVLSISGGVVTTGTQVDLAANGFVTPNLNLGGISILPSGTLVSVSAPKNTGVLIQVSLTLSGANLTYNTSSLYTTSDYNYNCVLNDVVGTDLAILVSNGVTDSLPFAEVTRVSSSSISNKYAREQLYTATLSDGISMDKLSDTTAVYSGTLNESPYSIITGAILTRV